MENEQPRNGDNHNLLGKRRPSVEGDGVNIEEMLKKLGFQRRHETQIFEISLGGGVCLHLEAAYEMTIPQLQQHIVSQLEVLRTNLNMHISGTISQVNKLTRPNLENYEDAN